VLTTRVYLSILS